MTNAPVWPCLSYDDAAKAVDWLVDAFGFEATLVVPGDDQRPVPHAELRTPWGGGVMLGSRVDGDPDPFASLPAGASNIYVVVDDPQPLFERCTAAGADIVRPMETTDYGSTGFSVRDPEGNLWSFGTYAGA